MIFLACMAHHTLHTSPLLSQTFNCPLHICLIPIAHHHCSSISCQPLCYGIANPATYNTYYSYIIIYVLISLSISLPSLSLHTNSHPTYPSVEAVRAATLPSSLPAPPPSCKLVTEMRLIADCRNRCMVRRLFLKSKQCRFQSNGSRFSLDFQSRQRFSSIFLLPEYSIFAVVRGR